LSQRSGPLLHPERNAGRVIATRTERPALGRCVRAEP
jgi:hypothetical protein